MGEPHFGFHILAAFTVQLILNPIPASPSQAANLSHLVRLQRLEIYVARVFMGCGNIWLVSAVILHFGIFKRLGVRPDISTYVLAILNALSIIGRILPPHLGDKIGRLNVLILGVFLCGVLQYGLWYPASGTLLIIAFSVVWGAASGIYISVYPSVIPQIFGMKDNRSRLVIFLLCGVPGCMAGPSLAGLLIKGTGAEGYNNMAWFTGTTMVVSSVLLLILRLSISTKLRVFL